MLSTLIVNIALLFSFSSKSISTNPCGEIWLEPYGCCDLGAINLVSHIDPKTNKIDWDNSYKMIVAKDSVMFTTSEGDTLYGIGFESDSDLEEWKIFKLFGIARDGI